MIINLETLSQLDNINIDEFVNVVIGNFKHGHVNIYYNAHETMGRKKLLNLLDFAATDKTNLHFFINGWVTRADVATDDYRTWWTYTRKFSAHGAMVSVDSQPVGFGHMLKTDRDNAATKTLVFDDQQIGQILLDCVLPKHPPKWGINEWVGASDPDVIIVTNACYNNKDDKSYLLTHYASKYFQPLPLAAICRYAAIDAKSYDRLTKSQQAKTIMFGNFAKHQDGERPFVDVNFAKPPTEKDIEDFQNQLFNCIVSISSGGWVVK